MTITLSQLFVARSADELLAQLIQALKGVGFVRQTGTGTGRVQATGVAQGNFAVVVEVTATGEAGTAQYRVSLNGGGLWSDPSPVPAAPVGLPGTGVTIAFVAGPPGAGASFVALDRFSFYVATPTFGQTAWQPFSWQRRILELEAEAGGDVDALVSAIAAGGYLDEAAAAWLDLYCDNVYDELRHEAIQAKGVCVLTDAGNGGPYSIAAGQLWVATADGTLRFVNTTAGSLPEGETLALEFAAESPGAAFNVGNGAIAQLITPLPGVTVANPSRVGGVIPSRTGAPRVVAFASGSLQGDYRVRLEVTTSGDLGVAVFRYSLDGGSKWSSSAQLVPASGQYLLGTTGLSLNFAAGAYKAGDLYDFEATVSWLSQAGVDRETDEALRVRCRKKWASLAIGRTNAGFEYWALEASDQVTRAFARQSAAVPGRVELFLAGASGGVSAAIVAVVDAYVQPRVPLTTSCVTASAKTVTVAVAGTVYVRSGLRTQAQAAAEAALAEYIAAVPIGGEKVGVAGVVSREVLAACIARGSPANRVDGVVDLSLTTPAADVALGATEVPILDVSNLTWTEV
jgi:uncharacterized phage protein gp47/JayE